MEFTNGDAQGEAAAAAADDSSSREDTGAVGGSPKVLRQGYPVPTELIGFIIGKNGANIDTIEKASSAKLSITEDNGPKSFQREWVYIHIEGTGRDVSGLLFHNCRKPVIRARTYHAEPHKDTRASSTSRSKSTAFTLMSKK